MNFTIRNRPAQARATPLRVVSTTAQPAGPKPACAVVPGRAWYHDAAIAEARHTEPRPH